MSAVEVLEISMEKREELYTGKAKSVYATDDEKSVYLPLFRLMIDTACAANGAQQVKQYWDIYCKGRTFSSELLLEVVVHVSNEWKEHIVTFLQIVAAIFSNLIRSSGFQEEPFKSMLQEFIQKQQDYAHHTANLRFIGLPLLARRILFQNDQEHPDRGEEGAARASQASPSRPAAVGSGPQPGSRRQTG